jgi:hypothetical protein
MPILYIWVSIPSRQFLTLLRRFPDFLIPLTSNMCSVMISDRNAMNLVTTVRVDPEDPRQLLAVIEHFNRACNALSRLAFETKTFGWLALQRAFYHWLRREYGLNAAQAVVAVRKVAYAYSDHKRRGHVAKFAKRGAIPIYDGGAVTSQAFVQERWNDRLLWPSPSLLCGRGDYAFGQARSQADLSATQIRVVSGL